MFPQTEEADKSDGLRLHDQDSEEDHSKLHRAEVQGEGHTILCRDSSLPAWLRPSL